MSASKLTRRNLMKAGMAGGLGIAASGGFMLDTYDIRISNASVSISDLPDSFDGFKIVHLTDIHCRKMVSYEYLQKVFRMAAAEKPDMYMLTGDYVSHNEKDIPRVMKLIAGLEAESGKVAVLGNHDHWTNAPLTIRMLEESGVKVLTNRNLRIEKGGAEICVAGVGDLWEDEQKLEEAYEGIPETTPRLLMSHNPDYAEKMPAGYRTDLMISGHTHGGQVALPIYGPPVLPSKYGQKYAAGLVQGPRCPVYISRGVGFIAYFRWNCPPEISIITLHHLP